MRELLYIDDYLCCAVLYCTVPCVNGLSESFFVYMTTCTVQYCTPCGWFVRELLCIDDYLYCVVQYSAVLYSMWMVCERTSLYR